LFAFRGCRELDNIIFEGNAPTIHESTFTYYYHTTAYYPAGNATWTEDKLLDYGGDITWVPYCVGEHSYGAWEITKEVTADSEGREQAVCAGCGDVKVRRIVPVALTATVEPVKVNKGAKPEDVKIGLSASQTIGGGAVADLEMEYVITDKDGKEISLEEALKQPGEYTITPKVKTP
jgi:hypothetical protein